jgi:hypothetical protein
MTRKPTLIAGEPLPLLRRAIRSLEVKRRGDDTFHISWRTDSESGAAWLRAIERCAADFITADRQDPIEIRRKEALLLIAKVMAIVNDGDV